MTGPIGSLIDTAERVGKGDLKARVIGPARRDEIGNLSRAFNKMTGQLERQQDALLEANAQLGLSQPLHRSGARRSFGRGHRPGRCGAD